MTVRLEGLSPDGKRVPLALEGSTLTSLCMQVAHDAPVFVSCDHPREESEGWQKWLAIRRAGYRNVLFERIKES